MITSFIKNLVHASGFEVKHTRYVRPMDFSDCDPIGAIPSTYQANGRSLIMNVRLGDVLHFKWLSFPCTSTSGSPFIRTLVAYKNGTCSSYIGSALESFYHDWQPETAAQMLGIKSPAHPAIKSYGPAAALHFWQPDELSTNISRRKRKILKDHREHNVDLDHRQGDQFFGPVSMKKGEFEYKRLIDVFESIQRHGFEVDTDGHNNIVVLCLYCNKQHKERYLVIQQGEHRVAALTALGYENIPVQLAREGLGGVVQRSDVRWWPAVTSGYLTEHEALTLFDRMFAGLQPWES